MKEINIEKDLKRWLVDYITNKIHTLEIDGYKEFNEWAKSFKREEAEFVVGMEFVVDWGYDEREFVSESEATKYAYTLMEKILDVWYL